MLLPEDAWPYRLNMSEGYRLFYTSITSLSHISKAVWYETDCWAFDNAIRAYKEDALFSMSAKQKVMF